MKGLGRLAALALLLAGQGGCAPQPPRAEREARTDRPRVMSLNPCVDAILLQVAEPDQILSISHYSHDPRSASVDVALARRFPPNFETAEEVVARRPDMVLLGPHVAPATQNALRAMGVRIVSVAVPTTIAESLDQVRAVARVVGHADRGEVLARRIEAALADAAPPPGAPPVPALIRQGGGMVPGTGTLADELMARTGFRNMSADYGLAMWDILPLELMVMNPPRVLLTEGAHDRSLAGIEVADYPDRLFHCSGPNLIEAAERLARIRTEFLRP